MLAYYRRHVSARLATIWLVVVIPLTVVLLVTFYAWYSAQLSLVQRERLENAQATATSFQLLLLNMRFSLRVSGGEIADSGPSSSASAEELRRVESAYPAANVLFADSKGRVLASSPRGLAGTSVSGDAAFAEAMAAPDGNGIEPSHDASGGVVGFHVAQMIPTRAGRDGGVMLMLVDVGKLHRSFPVMVTTGGISVIDSAGQVVFQSERVRFAEERARWGDIFPVVNRALQGHVSSTRDFRFPTGGRRIAVFVPIPRSGWVAGSSVAPKAGLLPVYRTLAIALPLALAVGLLALMTSVRVSNGIRGSLGRLGEDARRIGSGELEEPVRVDRHDEIGDVARSMEAARAELLESRRTAERVYEEQSRGRAFAEKLDEINRVVHSSTEHEQTVQQALELAGRMIGASAGAVFLDSGGVSAARYQYGFPEGFVGTRYAGEIFPFAALLERTNEPVTVTESQLEELMDAGVARQFGVRSLLAVPLSSHGRLIGGVGLVFTESHDFTGLEEDFARKFGAAVSLALENARLLETERERARLSEALNTIDRSIHGTMSADEMLSRVLPEAAAALGTDSAAMGYRESGGWRVRFEHRLREGLERRLFRDDELATAALAARTQQVVVVDDALTDPRVNADTAREFDARSLIVGPLVALDDVIGVVMFIHHATPRTFSSDDVEFVRRLAVSLGLALTNARLYEAEHDIAETLQTALLALPERMEGIDFAHLYHSATEAARVGGDFYDLFELEHDCVGITVGDISGHGIDAAVLTSLVKNAIRVQATQEDKTPDSVMASASRILYENSPTEIFATVFFGVLHLEDGLLEYCSAGHTTGVCIRSNGGTLRLPPNSPLIGAFAQEDFELSTERMGVHDLLFLYTDGLTEARRGSELFGEERLFELLTHERGGDPEHTMRVVVDAVLSFSGGTLSDDLAILAVQRGGEGFTGIDARGDEAGTKR